VLGPLKRVPGRALGNAASTIQPAPTRFRALDKSLHKLSQSPLVEKAREARDKISDRLPRTAQSLKKQSKDFALEQIRQIRSSYGQVGYGLPP